MSVVVVTRRPCCKRQGLFFAKNNPRFFKINGVSCRSISVTTTNKGERKMNITLNDKEHRLVCIALSYLSSNVDDVNEAFDEDDEINEDDVIGLCERVSSVKVR